MRQGIKKFLLFAGIYLILLAQTAAAQQPGGGRDVFKGKLFAPNIILQHQQELALTKEQYTSIRAAIVEVQAGVAEHEWDLREAYMRVLADLDESPVDEDTVLANVEAALKAENSVKRMQVRLLIRLRNLLTDEQIEYLQAQREEQKKQ